MNRYQIADVGASATEWGQWEVVDTWSGSRICLCQSEDEAGGIAVLLENDQEKGGQDATQS